mmetsp:Transcript_64711/g.152134  ORF Transcript_64711/g.152134 Transcript_64711/m.152134 type:complete len:209 (-) Transcript_64711:1238-1864(-)
MLLSSAHCGASAAARATTHGADSCARSQTKAYTSTAATSRSTCQKAGIAMAKWLVPVACGVHSARPMLGSHGSVCLGCGAHAACPKERPRAAFCGAWPPRVAARWSVVPVLRCLAPVLPRAASICCQALVLDRLVGILCRWRPIVTGRCFFRTSHTLLPWQHVLVRPAIARCCLMGGMLLVCLLRVPRRKARICTAIPLLHQLRKQLL